MQVITLYRYTRADGGVTVSPVKPDAPYTARYRLIADEGMALTRDESEPVSCVDSDTAEGWTEVAEETEDFTEEETQWQTLPPD